MKAIGTARGPRPADERGAFAILFAVLLVMLFIFAALVIDLGSMRADIRLDQSMSDSAATAGASGLDPIFGGSPKQACETAWGYVLANSPGLATVPPSPCGVFTGMPPCGVATPPREANGTAGPFRVKITYPVPDGSPLMQARSNSTIDSTSCARLGVTVERTRTFGFGAVISARAGNTWASAVARASTAGSSHQGISMIVLDPVGCNALIAKGQAQVEVSASGGYPGIIAVDSAATLMSTPSGQSDRNCSNPSTVAVDAVGTTNTSITTGDGTDPSGNPVAGAIFSYALMPGQNNAQSYEQADVMSGRLRPRPIAHDRITRQPVDWRYNCKAANGCPARASTPPAIDNLRALVGTTGAPAGYREFPRDFPGAACKMQPSTPPVTVVGNVWVNCVPFDVSNAATFVGGNVIFQGKVNVGSGGLLSVNAGSAADRWVYLRGGDFEKDAQAGVILNNTFVYMHSGRISFGAGSGVLRWVAPNGGDFEDLTLWSESSLQHELGGQAVLDLEGTFFAPNAYPFRYAGQGAQQQAKAQFITYRLEITGQGKLILAVDPERSVKVPMKGVVLIR